MPKDTFEKLIESEKPLLIDFYADWCGPCRAQAPILEQLKDKMGDEIRIIKIDTDKNQALSQKLGIRGIPALKIYQNGELQWEASGVQTLGVLEAQLKPLLV